MATTNNNIDVKMQALNLQSEVLGGSSNVSRDNNIPEDSSVAAISGISAVNDTTKFVDDADMTMRDESHVSHISRSLLSLNDTQIREQSLIDFLSKPITLDSGTFSISDTFSFFNSKAMPYSAFISSQGSVWTQKLAGYFGIRMDMRFRLVINANPFQQGRYMLGWTPLAGMVRTSSQLKAYNVMFMHNATLVQRTTVPHVEIDISSGTSAELLVPFVSTTAFYPLNSILTGADENILGFVNLYPYSPLVSPAGSTVASYTLYVSFENVSLFGAASAQSGFKSSSHRPKSNSEVAARSLGPVSGVATSISRGFKEFSSIPLIGGVATDIAWVADRVASVASIFGFSKPNEGGNSGRVELMIAPNHSTVDGDSNARSLGIISQPGVSNLEGISGTDYDEMDFSYVARKYAYFATYTFPTSAVPGLLQSIPVRPDIGVVVTGGGVPVYNYTPLAFTAFWFAKWRGSIKFRFKFVKTPFHSGRLAFSFYPTDESAYVANPAYVNRVIVDVRETTEVEIIVPYISRFPWLPRSSKIGVLNIEVIDPLVAPATVSSSVTILTEVAGGDDVEFSIPTSEATLTPKTVTPQSGFIKPGSDDKTLISETIGSSSVNMDPIVNTSLCIGEKITSFRTLLRRYHPLRRNTTRNVYSTAENSAEIRIVPDMIVGLEDVSVTSLYIGDVYSAVGSCYALSRGGVRIRDVLDLGMVTTSTSSTTPTSSAILSSQQSNLYTYCVSSNHGLIAPVSGSVPTTTPSDFVSRTIQNVYQNNVVSVEIPQYTQTYARAVGDIIGFQATAPSTALNYNSTTYSSNTNTLLQINVPVSLTLALFPADNYTFHNIYRAMADDASFSTFVSVPSFVKIAYEGTFAGTY